MLWQHSTMYKHGLSNLGHRNGKQGSLGNVRIPTRDPITAAEQAVRASGGSLNPTCSTVGWLAKNLLVIVEPGCSAKVRVKCEAP
jgi:hypothetical protein